MLKLPIRNPANGFALLALMTLVIVAGAALWIARLPMAGVVVVPVHPAMVSVNGLGPFPDRTPARFVDGAGQVRLTVPLGTLALLREPGGGAAESRAAYAQRELASRLVREPGMMLVLPDHRRIAASIVPGGLARMPAGAWLALAMGLVSALTGWWLLVLRPHEWAARTFALSAAAMLLAAITIAAAEKLSLAMGAAFQLRLSWANLLAAHGYGLSLVALFARYPAPLLSRRVLGLAAVGMGLLWAASLAAPSGALFLANTAMVAAEGLAIVALSLIQAWRARRDPALRVAFRLIGASLLACLLFFLAVNLIPQMLGYVDLIGAPLSSCVFLLFNLALAVAITRYRLFDLGGWAMGVAWFALGIVGVLLVDIALVALTGATWTLSGAFLLAAVIWLPLREALLRQADRRRTRDDVVLLRGASRVAFALGPDEQQRQWRFLLEQRFAPLTIATCASERAAIRDDGRGLEVPSPFGGEGLVLRFAGQGSRLFGSTDRTVAEALVQQVREMVAARVAYDRGVQEERRRIARDLHDDVGARLMTSLHRVDLDTAHADVREAMADMRLIIDGMAGQSRPLGDLLADLRHETVTRLRLAHIGADWPMTGLFDDPRRIEPACSRVLCAVLRELTSNVIRHSRAGQARIATTLDHGAFALTVEDDGCGFDSASLPGGNGLRNMMRRLNEAGGTIAIASDAAGTRTRIVLPLGSPERGMAATACAAQHGQG